MIDYLQELGSRFPVSTVLEISSVSLLQFLFDEESGRLASSSQLSGASGVHPMLLSWIWNRQRKDLLPCVRHSGGAMPPRAMGWSGWARGSSVLVRRFP